MRRPLLLLLTVFAFASCDTTSSGASGPEGCGDVCSDDWDCPGTMLCEQGSCWDITCYQESTHCSPEGSACSVNSDCCNGACNGGVCISNASCTSGADCASSAQCCNTLTSRCGPC